MILAAFKIEDYKLNEILSTSPYASFVGRIYEKPEEYENDCKFGVNLFEYNAFNFGNKGKMNFKIQVVYEAGPDSRFRKLSPKLEIGKLIFISGFFDLDNDEFPFIEAKEIDLLDEFTNNVSQNQTINFKSTFSLAQKFKNSKNNLNTSQLPMKKTKNLH